VVTNLKDEALYFSRSPIPYVRYPSGLPDGSYQAPRFLLHVGIYLYRRDILEKLVTMEPTPLEKTEGLEQLRALESGVRIRCIWTKEDFMGVDTLADVPRVEAALRSRLMSSESSDDSPK